MSNKGIETMNFGTALEKLKAGDCVARLGWNGKGIYLKLQRPDDNSKMTLPYIYIVTSGLVSDNPLAPRGTVPWLASQTDMLADDWVVAETEDTNAGRYVGVGFGLSFWEAVAAIVHNKNAAMRVKGWTPGILVRMGTEDVEGLLIHMDQYGKENFWLPTDFEMKSAHWEVWERSRPL